MPKLRKWWPGGRPALIAAVSGLASCLAFPPWDIWPLGLLALAVLTFLLLSLEPRHCFTVGLIFSATLKLVQLHWLTYVMTVYGQVFTPLAWLLLAMLALFLGLFAALACWSAGVLRRGGISLLLGLPLAWAAQEWLLQWIFTGFPWLPWALSLSGALPLLQSAELWGAGGVSALTVLVAVLLALAARNLLAAPRRWGMAGAALAVAALIVTGGWLWGQTRLESVRQEMQAAPKLTTTVLQANVSLEELWSKKHRLRNVTRQAKLSRLAAVDNPQRPWLVVWSESAAPFFFLRPGRPSQPIMDVAQDIKAYILFGTEGAQEKNGRVRLTNRSWLVDSQGRPGSFYDKVHLVPFGEYVPLSDILFFIKAVAVIGADFAPGEQGDVLQAGDVVLGPLICYESIFPDLAREQVKRGAQLLINQTNDAWYGPTWASRQHLSHLILRAIETRRACARSANTGISCFVLPDGQVVDSTKLFQTTWRTRRLPLMDGQSAYVRLGPLVGPLGGGLVLLLIAVVIFRARKQGLKEK